MSVLTDLSSQAARIARAACFLVFLLFLAVPASTLAAEEGAEPEGSAEGDEGVETPAPQGSTPTGGSSSGTGTSLTQSLQGDSGISIQTLCTNCNNADLSVGGLDNDYIEVMCDGMSVPSGLAQIYLLSVMPGTMIDKVEINKGAGDPELSGSAVGGGIEIERREPKPGYAVNYSSDFGEYGGVGAKLDLSGQVGRFGGSLAQSWGTSDAIKTTDRIVDPSTQEEVSIEKFTLPAYDRFTVDGKGNIRLGRNQTLSFGFVTYDESQEDGPAAFKGTGYARENVELDRQQYTVQYRAPFRNGSSLEVSAGWAERSQDIAETESASFTVPFNTTYLIDEVHQQASIAWSQPIGQGARVRIGASGTRSDYDIVDVNFNQLHPEFCPIPPDVMTFDELREAWESCAFTEKVTETGYWVEGQTALGARVELSAGVRYTDFRYEDDEDRDPWKGFSLPEGDRWLPRAALMWKPVDPLEFRISAGTGFRAADPAYDKVCCGRRYRNNRGIVTEESESYGLEITYQPRPEIRVGGSAFVTDFDDHVINLISLSEVFLPTYQNVNVPEARYTSYTIDTRLDLTNWFSAKASASWLDAENRTPGDAVPVLIDNFDTPQPEVFTFEEIPYVVERQGTVGFEFRPGWGATLGLSAQFTGEQKIEEMSLVGLEPDLVDSDEFWLVNANFSKTFKRVTLFGGVDNIGDYIQEDFVDPRFDTNWGALRGRYYFAGLGYRFTREK